MREHSKGVSGGEVGAFRKFLPSVVYGYRFYIQLVNRSMVGCHQKIIGIYTDFGRHGGAFFVR